MIGITTELVQAFASCFIHCWDTYAVQQADGSYRRAQESLSLGRVADHLSGRYTLGTYLLDGAGTCRVAVFDDDRVDGLARLWHLAGELAADGCATVLEASRRGGHLWVLLSQPTPAYAVRTWLLPLARAYEMELYPKQDRRRNGGPGSLIRLPLGVHRQTQGWYPFVGVGPDGGLIAVGDTVADCCAWIVQHAATVQVPAAVITGVQVGAEVMTPVGQAVGSGEPMVQVAALTSENSLLAVRGAIRAWCLQQDILAVIGRYVALDAHGVGSCPFKEHHYRGDLRPSFQVFGGADPHWYCYTAGRGGDLFEFFCASYQLSPHEAWSWLQEGRLV